MFDRAQELVLVQLPAAVSIELLEVGHHGDVVVVDEFNELPEHVLEGLVVDVHRLKPILDDFQLHIDIEVVLPEVLNDVVLQVNLSFDVFEPVDSQSEFCLFDGVIDVLVV